VNRWPIRYYIREHAEKILLPLRGMRYEHSKFTTFDDFCSDFEEARFTDYDWESYATQTIRMNVKIMITNDESYRPNRKHYQDNHDDLFYLEDDDRLRLFDRQTDPAPIPSDVGTKRAGWLDYCYVCEAPVGGPDFEYEWGEQPSPKCGGCGKRYCFDHLRKMRPLPWTEGSYCPSCYGNLNQHPDDDET